ncbi:MAG: hypothetical protein ACXAC7_11205 [Candidatus Hodarchaeales archaeon]|jgi:hypothetical protein
MEDKFYMIGIQFVIILFSVLNCFIASSIIMLKARKSPIVEMKILGLSYIFMTIGYLFFLPLTAIDLTIPIDPQRLENHLFKIGIVLVIAWLMTWSLALILPTFNASYRSIVGLTLGISIFVASASSNYLTMTTEAINEQVNINYHPIGLFLFSASIILFVYSLISRFTEVRSLLLKSQLNSGTAFFSRLPLTLLVVSGLSTVMTIILPSVFPYSGFPSFISTLPSSLGILYLAYLISKDEAFFFITPAKLDSIIIIDQKTGFDLHAHNFIDALPLPAQQFLGGILSTLNISLKEAIQSKKPLEQISFGDKTIIVVPGKSVTLIMIVSENNFVIKAISKFLIEKLEQWLYNQSLLRTDPTNFFNQENFSEFSLMISAIRPYIPL